ncbi:MAG: hypothetical protein RLZZ40_560 [Actinomycetota bacterium]|jgi:hypothetical protein
MKQTRTIIGVVVMATLLVLYIGFAGYEAVLLVATGQPLAITFGAALFVAPAIGIWSLVRELKFGREAGALLNRFVAEYGPIAIPTLDKGSGVPEPNNPTWDDLLIFGLTLDSVGKRREARAAVRRAIAAAKVNSNV